MQVREQLRAVCKDAGLAPESMCFNLVPELVRMMRLLANFGHFGRRMSNLGLLDRKSLIKQVLPTYCLPKLGSRLIESKLMLPSSIQFIDNHS